MWEKELKKAMSELIDALYAVAPAPKDISKEQCKNWGDIFKNTAIIKNRIDELCK